MKKCVFMLFAVLVLLVACDSGQLVRRENVDTTDLSSVRIEGLAVGETILPKNLDQLTPAEPGSFTEQANCWYFKEIYIQTDENGFILLLQGNVGAAKEDIERGGVLILGKSGFKTIQEITSVLGDHYHEYWFDREQAIKAHTYYDAENEIDATFAFQAGAENLIWVILRGEGAK